MAGECICSTKEITELNRLEDGCGERSGSESGFSKPVNAQMEAKIKGLGFFLTTSPKLDSLP